MLTSLRLIHTDYDWHEVKSWMANIDTFVSDMRSRPDLLPFDEGLSGLQFDTIERRFAIVFPQDLRYLLAQIVPRGTRMPDWHHPDDPRLRAQLDAPFDGLMYEIVQSEAHWPKQFGPRPSTVAECTDHATRSLAALNRLIPVFANRYVLSGGSPPSLVISIEGSDVASIYRDIAYSLAETVVFGSKGSYRPRFEVASTEVGHIPFWSDLPG